MKKNPLSILSIIIISTLLTGCPGKESIYNPIRTKINDLIQKKDRDLEKSDKTKRSVKVIETLNVTISCNRDTIQKYLDNGWEIVDSKTSEVPCTWKTTKLTEKCDIDLDKGCSITIPDLMGEQVKYTLQKQVSNKDGK